eukprot:TRINITY_DN53204_c0_g1_i1.p1 TRINITY_DN53204_c0_g1~~TRINITY_DN53204_c0_g1_i1.p1  ORF type:complete len:553 (-),score=117.34 TRINITY_DN53204_c0_g1_i1:1264-2922(-)
MTNRMGSTFRGGYEHGGEFSFKDNGGKFWYVNTSGPPNYNSFYRQSGEAANTPSNERKRSATAASTSNTRKGSSRRSSSNLTGSASMPAGLASSANNAQTSPVRGKTPEPPPPAYLPTTPGGLPHSPYTTSGLHYHRMVQQAAAGVPPPPGGNATSRPTTPTAGLGYSPLAHPSQFVVGGVGLPPPAPGAPLFPPRPVTPTALPAAARPVTPTAALVGAVDSLGLPPRPTMFGPTGPIIPPPTAPAANAQAAIAAAIARTSPLREKPKTPVPGPTQPAPIATPATTGANSAANSDARETAPNNNRPSNLPPQPSSSSAAVSRSASPAPPPPAVPQQQTNAATGSNTNVVATSVTTVKSGLPPPVATPAGGATPTPTQPPTAGLAVAPSSKILEATAAQAALAQQAQQQRQALLEAAQNAAANQAGRPNLPPAPGNRTSITAAAGTTEFNVRAPVGANIGAAAGFGAQQPPPYNRTADVPGGVYTAYTGAVYGSNPHVHDLFHRSRMADPLFGARNMPTGAPSAAGLNFGANQAPPRPADAGRGLPLARRKSM